MNESQEPTQKTPSEPPSESSPVPSQASNPKHNEAFDRTTVIAFGLLFVLPAVIIVFTALFFLPYILNTLVTDPSGVAVPAPNLPPPGRP